MTGFRIAILAAVWIVGACSAVGGPSESPVASAAASQSAGAIDLPISVIDPVVAEIARIAGVGVDQVIILSAVSVTFPDSSLGCPLPGMAYSQIVTDGYRIVATAAGATYDYRGTGTSFRRCLSGGG
ncbi:MAG: hypothetical protein QOC97_90 [Chloroflexota bacterium]|jgi:hypothetical protein|nr:hypothetical protein [Chloroflexota bacterium]